MSGRTLLVYQHVYLSDRLLECDYNQLVNAKLLHAP